MRRRAAAYTLQPGVVVRGVITVMPFSLLWVRQCSIVGERPQNGRIDTLAVRSMNQRPAMTIATDDPPPMTILA